jgi:hypothetical protein
MLRAGQFRSALSNFHSLHSVYYDDFYQPDSLYLRGLVYLYICKYDELEKVLEVYDRVYKPVYAQLKQFMATKDISQIYAEFAKLKGNFTVLKSSKASRKNLQLPFLISRQVLREGDVKRTFNYLMKLEDERKRINSLPGAWQGSGIGRVAKSAIEKRILSTRGDVARLAKGHLSKMLLELEDLSQQVGFLQIEMISGKKEIVKKELAGRGIDGRIDDKNERNYYVQNGYEYWPFSGEYWLDEIGNYQYVGVRSCN